MYHLFPKLNCAIFPDVPLFIYFDMHEQVVLICRNHNEIHEAMTPILYFSHRGILRLLQPFFLPGPQSHVYHFQLNKRISVAFDMPKIALTLTHL